MSAPVEAVEPDASASILSAWKGRSGSLAVAAVGIAVLVALLLTLPRLDGTTWAAVARLIGSVSLPQNLALAGLWSLGLIAHTWVQLAALPGLRRRDALTLNLGGSAVAGALPAGGPLSLAVNWSMLRSWGFTTSQFSSYTMVTTVVTTAARLSVPLVAAFALLGGPHLPAKVAGASRLAAVGILVMIALVALALLPAVRRRLLRISRPARVAALLTRAGTVAADALATSGAALRTRRRDLLLGAAAQTVVQYLLLLGCLAVMHAGVGPRAALIAFGLGRLLSLAPITPGGLGVTEALVGALLVAFGAPPSAAVGAVLLHSLYVVVLEIPVGAGALALWRTQVRRARTVRTPGDRSPDGGGERPSGG
ncbi:lysylphosphatidylglycerol synthase domain-containing protein [Cellulomonas sp. McL0617]|uniref:lysylphosphatidylglycerol synthase domain-containing protein n=1 Tax=Cellulomonas sp. McL0617 TaxID=3415675 RepID=UPI003CE9D8F6